MRYSKSMLSNLIGQAYIIPIIAFLAFVGLSLLSCDNHAAVDTNMHIGYVLCEDNSCMDTATYFHQTSKKGVGVVFFEKNDTVPALAVMLHEYTGAYSDTVPITFGTSTNIKGINGRSNTVAMSSSSNGKGSSPIAQIAFTSHADGQSEYIPCVMEMRLLSQVAPYINPIIERMGGTPIALTGDCWYWTSNEVSGNENNQAWLCSAPNGSILESSKIKAHKVRTIIQINYPE
jgi:hypothetical protein